MVDVRAGGDADLAAAGLPRWAWRATATTHGPNDAHPVAASQARAARSTAGPAVGRVGARVDAKPAAAGLACIAGWASAAARGLATACGAHRSCRAGDPTSAAVARVGLRVDATRSTTGEACGTRRDAPDGGASAHHAALPTPAYVAATPAVERVVGEVGAPFAAANGAWGAGARATATAGAGAIEATGAGRTPVVAGTAMARVGAGVDTNSSTTCLTCRAAAGACTTQTTSHHAALSGAAAQSASAAVVGVACHVAADTVAAGLAGQEAGATGTALGAGDAAPHRARGAFGAAVATGAAVGGIGEGIDAAVVAASSARTAGGASPAGGVVHAGSTDARRAGRAADVAGTAVVCVEVQVDAGVATA